MPVKALIVVVLALWATSARAEAPNGLVLSPSSVAENQPPGTLVGTFTTLDIDPGDTFTYILIENPLDAFVLNGDRLETAATLDYEAGAQRSVRVRSTDASGGYQGAILIPPSLPLGNYDVFVQTPGDQRCGTGRSE